jgi:hypothetical protein
MIKMYHENDDDWDLPDEISEEDKKEIDNTLTLETESRKNR